MFPVIVYFNTILSRKHITSYKTVDIVHEINYELDKVVLKQRASLIFKLSIIMNWKSDWIKL